MHWACIIPTWNSCEVIGDCLRSVERQEVRFNDVIVVDNGSTDNSREIARSFPFVRILTFSENQGFSAAINAGVRATNAGGIVMLNADACIDPGFLRAIDEDASSNPDVDLFAPKILLNVSEKGPPIIENTGNRMWLDGLNWCVGRGEPDHCQYDAGPPPMFPSGAVCAVRRAVFERVGWLDEAFFAYGEDADFGLRAFFAGHVCRFVAQARAVHRLSHSLGMNASTKVHLIERNRVLLVWKNFPASLLGLSFIFAAYRYSVWLLGPGKSSRVRPVVECLGRRRILRIVIGAHCEAGAMILSGAVRRNVVTDNSLSFLVLARPYLVGPTAIFSD